MKKAWRLTYEGTTCVMAAQTRGQALFRLLHELMDLGYQNAKPGQITCRRAPEYDVWAELDATLVCWDERYLPHST